VSFAAFIVVVYFVIDSVRKLLDTPSDCKYESYYNTNHITGITLQSINYFCLYFIKYEPG
jgi:hypothetical protein